MGPQVAEIVGCGSFSGGLVLEACSQELFVSPFCFTQLNVNVRVWQPGASSSAFYLSEMSPISAVSVLNSSVRCGPVALKITHIALAGLNWLVTAPSMTCVDGIRSIPCSLWRETSATCQDTFCRFRARVFLVRLILNRSILIASLTPDLACFLQQISLSAVVSFLLCFLGESSLERLKHPDLRTRSPPGIWTRWTFHEPSIVD